MPTTMRPDGVGTRAEADGNGRRPLPTITRTSSLPSGRAVVGGLLVTLAVLGTFLAVRGGHAEPTDRYVVAARNVDQGDRLRPSDLRVAAIDLPGEVSQHTFGELEALEGAVTLAPLREGGLVQASQVLPASSVADDPLEPTHELSLRLPRDQAVDGGLNRGERVDILATYGTSEDATTVVVVRDALVTSIGHPDDAGLGDDGGVTLTLQVAHDDDVLRLTHAKDVASVTLVRASRDGGDPTGGDSYSGPLPQDGEVEVVPPEERSEG